MNSIRCNSRPVLSSMSALPTDCRRRSGLQATPGTYALLMLCTADAVVQIGQLGQLPVCPGYYVYVGSALGPGGVRARVAHHCRRAQRPHWHIDYLRAVVPLVAVWYTYARQSWEHHWAEVLQYTRGAAIPLRRFGASDCACAAHLYCFPRRPAWNAFRSSIRTTFHDHPPVYCQRFGP
jgi:Uri superfamily endonuclease